MWPDWYRTALTYSATHELLHTADVSLQNLTASASGHGWVSKWWQRNVWLFCTCSVHTVEDQRHFTKHVWIAMSWAECNWTKKTNYLYIKVPNGDAWPPVEAAFCQPAGTYQRAATTRRCCTATLLTLHYLAPSSLYHTNRLSLSRYRYLEDSAAWHVQPITVDMDTERGHCNGTRYVVRQVSRRYIECCSFCR